MNWATKTYAEFAGARDRGEPDTGRWPKPRPRAKKPRTCSLCGGPLDIAEHAVCDGCRGEVGEGEQ